MTNIKNEFANWLLVNAYDSYRQYLGNSINSIIDRLDEIQAFYPELAFFELDESNPEILIQEILKILNKKERIKNLKFIEYDKFHSNGIPKAIMGKNNYIKFINEKIKSGIHPETINYWIFQGNPKIYDTVASINANALHNWTVSSHKDKIKKGDKFILWLTGAKAGCYALGRVDSEVMMMKEEDVEMDYYVSTTSQIENYRVKIVIEHNFTSSPILWEMIKDDEAFKDFKGGNQGTNFTATKEEYDSIKKLISKVNKLIINISWNSKDWKEESKDKSNHEWVKNGGIPFESWNFANDAEGNTDEHIFGYAKFTNKPKITGKSIFIFYSDKKIVGFYGNGEIVEKKLKDSTLNLRGDQHLSFVLENKIEDIVEKGYLEDGKRIGQGGFNYLHKNETVLEILDEALALNPNQKNEIEKLKEWFMKETQSLESSKRNQEINFPLNQILYGPPGTGKTYHTILEAAKIVTGNENISYEDALNVFNTNLHNQIEFITFHQNYSYEDFIQGLRPDTENGNALTFDKKDGVFKRIADKALKNLTASKNPASVKKEFKDVFNELIQPLNNEEVNEIEIRMKKSSYFITEVGEKSIAFRKNIGDSEHTLSINTLHKMYDKGENDFILGGLQPYYNPLLQLLLDKGKSTVTAVTKNNYVIIIDEINRANISRVFGELITLIEEDKRSHGKIPMKVTLPSGDSFTVPSNLYIIGTMNTADKSIALLDIALRRRFEFVPMYPKYSGLEKPVNDDAILLKINEAIIKRKGHDFTIGHSYFMGENYSLEKTINHKVIPLLLEYFMNDEKEVTNLLKDAGITIGEWPLKMIS